MENVKVEDLEWYEFNNNPNILRGRDKEGNFYGINRNGELHPVSNDGMSLYIYWYRATIEDVKNLMAYRKKQYKQSLHKSYSDRVKEVAALNLYKEKT